MNSMPTQSQYPYTDAVMYKRHSTLSLF